MLGEVLKKGQGCATLACQGPVQRKRQQRLAALTGLGCSAGPRVLPLSTWPVEHGWSGAWESLLNEGAPCRHLPPTPEHRGPALSRQHPLLPRASLLSFGLAPAAPLQVHAPLSPNQTVELSLPLSTVGSVMKMEPLNNLQVCPHRAGTDASRICRPYLRKA